MLQANAHSWAVVCSLHIAVVLGSLETEQAQGCDARPEALCGAVADEASIDDDPTLVTPQAEAAVKRAFAFLAARQREDGSFGGEKVGPRDPAMTALCGMAFLSAGGKPGEGPYGEEVQKALNYVLDQVQENGFIAIRPHAGEMYTHAYALRFLAEAQATRKSPRTEKAIAKAVELIVKSQNTRDGWRYRPNSRDADSSVTSCQVIALQVARRASAEVPKETVERAIKYLKRSQTPDGGYSYTLPPNDSGLPRSAAVMSALYLSEVDSDEITKGLAYLTAKAVPPKKKSSYYFYTQFHLSTALRYAGDEQFRRWYVPSRDQLLDMQADDGSWMLRQWGQNTRPHRLASCCFRHESRSFDWSSNSASRR